MADENHESNSGLEGNVSESVKNPLKEMRIYGAKGVSDVLEDIHKIMDLKIGQVFQFQIVRACSGTRWYMFGQDSQYGNGMSEEYTIFHEEGTRLVYLKKLGQIAADLIKINAETGNPFTQGEAETMFVHIMPYIKDSKKTASVRTKTGSVRARFE